MEKELKLKIVLLGPTSTGKTYIANYLSDVTENAAEQLRKTKGVRVVEFQVDDIQVNGGVVNAEIELWDCSGDRKYEQCWPVFLHGADAVILVYTNESPEQKKDLEAMYTFLAKTETVIKHCTLFFLAFDGEDTKTEPKGLKNILSKVSFVTVNVEENSEELRNEFNKFVTKIVSQRIGD